MQTPGPSDSRKRRRSNPYPPDAEEEAVQNASKKHKAVHKPDPSQLTTHQEKPSPIPLERAALEALDLQNAQAARKYRLNQRNRRPVTRIAVSKWHRRHPPLEPARTYLERCRQGQYRALQNFAKHGGPNPWELRGCQRAALYMSKNPLDSSRVSPGSRSRSRRSIETKSTTESGTSKSLPPYDRSTQQVLVDSQVYPPQYKHSDGRGAPKPRNWDDIHKRLAQSRTSLSPSKFSQLQHDDFVELNASAAKENQVKNQVIPVIEGTIMDLQTSSAEISFNNLDPVVADKKLAYGKPDFFRGASPEDLRRSVREELTHTIVPSTQDNLPILPNHFTVAKGPDGTAAVAERQVTHGGFLGARAMQAVHDFGRAEPQIDGKAYTITSTYSNGQLRLFTTHYVKPDTPGGQPSYYSNALRSFSMIDTAETFRVGATYYRNSVDLTEEWRYDAMRRANEVVAHRDRVAQLASNDAGASRAPTESQLEEAEEPDKIKVES